MLGTSKAVHDDKSFDIFITTTPISDLNDRLVAFGRVVKGKDVVQVHHFLMKWLLNLVTRLWSRVMN